MTSTGAPAPPDWVGRIDFGTFEFTDPAIWSDPYPRYAAMRAESPVWYDEHFEEWLLLRHADVLDVLRDPRWSTDPSHRTLQLPEGEQDFRTASADAGAKVLLFLDPPDHTRIRRLVSKAFTPRTVERLRPHIGELVDELLDAAAERGRLDVVADLGYPLPVTVICELMGVPVEDRHLFGPWSSDATRLLDGAIDEETRGRGLLATMEILNYFNHLFDARRAEPRDDLVSALLAAEEEGDTLSEEELRSITVLLFLAGHETTMNLIGNGTCALLRHPDQLARLRADPSLVPAAVEELLRFDGPVHATARIATEDLSVGGVDVPAGQQVICLIAAANRDPAVFGPAPEAASRPPAAVPAGPDELDIGRHPNPHVAFSSGMHYCLGAALARVEAQVAIGELVRRFPRMELAEEPAHRDHFVLRGLRSLEVALH